MIAITHASLAHTEALAAIHALSFTEAERWPAPAIAAQLALPGTHALIAAQAGMIMLRALAGEGEILTLAVVPPCRRQGLARALIAAAITAATHQGARRLYLEVAATNGAAQTLYTAAGFYPTGRRPRYYADGGDAVIMARDLMDK